MPTNDERREVARRLRDNAGQKPVWVIPWAAFNDAYEHEGAELINRLADLIEPEERTCHMECVKSGPLYDVFRFDCCDKEYSESRTDDGATELPFEVCPFCGAKVVQQ